jgi:spermidine synthase
VLVVLLVVSGAAALIYQLLWIKQLSLVVGVDVYAVTTAVSAFFAGLAIGGALFGRIADKTPRPLRLYAILEIGVALVGLGASVALAHAASPFATLEARLSVLAWALPFTLVGLPAVLMGGTLPVLACAANDGRIARTGGRLYAANTAGAVAGCLLAPFVLIPAFGVRRTAFAAAILNLVAAATAWILSAAAATAASGHVGERQPQVATAASRMTAVWLYAVAGAIALGYEVVWSQAVAQFVSTRVFAFSIVAGHLSRRSCHRQRALFPGRRARA